MADNPNTVQALTRPARTAGYTPHVYTENYLGVAIDGRPRFTWLEAERMLYDPQIQFGLRVLEAPLFGVTWTVTADSPQVQAWVDREWGRLWRRLVPVMVGCYTYGAAAGELTFKAKRSRATGRTRIHFDDVLELHPRDVRPLVFETGCRAGDLAGLHVHNVARGALYLDRRHGFWFKGESKYGQWWGRPRLAGAHQPWTEKAGRFGAIDSRRLFYKKCAFRGPRMRYPVGKTDMGTPETGPMLVSNQDIAREIVEKFENGGVLALPNVKGPSGEDLWVWEDPESFSDVANILEYPKTLDKEILVGLGVPVELVEAGGTGSGYSGRAIPAQVFFTSMDCVVAKMFEAIDTQVMKFLVRLNFGKRTSYEVVPKSLAQLMAQAGPGGPPGQPPPPGTAGAPAGAPGGGLPYQGPRGGQGTRDPVTGAVHYQHHPEQSYTRLSHTEAAAFGYAPALPEPDPRTLWEESDGEVYEELPPPKAPGGGGSDPRPRLCLSWTPYTGPRGGRGWVSDSGEVRYQELPPAAREEDPGKGPDALFAHPDYAHLDHAGPGEPDFAGMRARYEAGAREQGLDPAAVHRAAAEQLHHRLDHVAADAGSDFAHPDKQRASVAALRTAAAAVPAAQRAAFVAPADAQERRLAERGGKAKPIDKAAVLDNAYSQAFTDLHAEHAARRQADEFAESYFSDDDPTDRARNYLAHLEDGDLDPARLDPDTRDAVAEDLAHLPAEDLAAHAVHTHDQHGVGDPAEYAHHAIAARAVELQHARLKKQGKLPHPGTIAGALAERMRPPDGRDAGPKQSLYFLSPEHVNEDVWQGIQTAAKLLPPLKARFLSPERGLLVAANSPLAEAIEAGGIDPANMGADISTEETEHAQPLFDALPAENLLPQADVPASAKDYGGTSGSRGSGAYNPETGWNPNAVDVYRRLDDDWYVRRHGAGTEHGRRTGAGYELVPAAQVPPLSRLPAPYWHALDTAPQSDSDADERAEVREAKTSAAGAAQRRDLRGHGTGRAFTKASQIVKGQHKRTGNLVRSDDALRDRVQALAGGYDFADGAGMPDPDRDRPTRERLDALEDALSELREIDHRHDYDPDAVEDFDASYLHTPDDARADTADVRERVYDDYTDWSARAWAGMHTAREAAQKEFHRFRGEDLGPKLRAARAAAVAVVGLPGNAIDAETREAARAVARGVLALRARARRPVRMSLAGFDPNEKRDEAGKWTEGGGAGATPEEVYGALSGAAKSWQASLGPDEREAIEDYTLESDRLNSALRNGLLNRHTEAQADAIDSALEKSELPIAFTAFRGLDADPGWQEGDEHADPAYLSVSTGRVMAEQFAGDDGVVLEIALPKGAKGADIAGLSPSYASEGEVLLPRDTPLRVTGKGRDARGRTVYRMEPAD